jgi:hypothetical protein
MKTKLFSIISISFFFGLVFFTPQVMFAETKQVHVSFSIHSSRFAGGPQSTSIIGSNVKTFQHTNASYTAIVDIPVGSDTFAVRPLWTMEDGGTVATYGATGLYSISQNQFLPPGQIYGAIGSYSRASHPRSIHYANDDRGNGGPDPYQGNGTVHFFHITVNAVTVYSSDGEEISSFDSGRIGDLGGSSVTYTHYSVSSWGACSGYDSETGQDGTQTRSVTSFKNTTGPNDSPPASSQSCNAPSDFNFLSEPLSEGESGTFGNTYSTFVTFIGAQQSAFSQPVTIAVSPVFANYPNPPDITFSVTNVSPALPSGVSYTFTPNPLTPSEYSDGAYFVANVPVTEPGLYVITVEASSGDIVKQATVNLNASAANPTFEEF